MQKFPIKKGLSSAQDLHDEIKEYIDVLMGHINPPKADGVNTLFEVSSTYLARAKEIEIKLLERERNTKIESGDELKKFRTGELRSFIELCKSEKPPNFDRKATILFAKTGPIPLRFSKLSAEQVLIGMTKYFGFEFKTRLL